MICPACGHTENAPGRARCEACPYPFVFQPEVDGTTDAEWLELLARTTGKDSYYFTENQLYARYARGRVQITREISRRGGLGLVMIAIGLAIWVYALKADWGLTLVLGVAITLTGVGQAGTGVVTLRVPTPRDPVRRWLEKWLAVQPIPKLIQHASLASAGLERAPARVERLVIVEHDELVDLLLKNGAHEQISALILSESGYPERLVLEARRVLDERSDLPIIALHDTTEHGVGLKSRLRTSTLLPLSDRKILDAGLFAAEVDQIEELTSAFPTSFSTRVPLDSLSYSNLLAGLRGIAHGALSISVGIFAQAENAENDSERAA